MRLVKVISAFFIFSIFFSPPHSALASGFATSENFIVYADTQELADEVLKRAEEYREKLAIQWFNKPFPDGVGVTVIHVRITPKDHTAFTFPKDLKGNYHHITIRTSKELILGGTLAHEISHALLANIFGNKMPRWIDEGIASFNDDTGRQLEMRAQIAAFAGNKKEWPSLLQVVNQVGVTRDEKAFYAASNYLVSYLLEIGTRDELLKFAGDLRGAKDPDAVVRAHYPAIRSLADLEGRWRAWAARLPAAYPCTAAHRR